MRNNLRTSAVRTKDFVPNTKESRKISTADNVLRLYVAAVGMNTMKHML